MRIFVYNLVPMILQELQTVQLVNFASRVRIPLLARFLAGMGAKLDCTPDPMAIIHKRMDSQVANLSFDLNGERLSINVATFSTQGKSVSTFKDAKRKLDAFASFCKMTIA